MKWEKHTCAEGAYLFVHGLFVAVLFGRLRVEGGSARAVPSSATVPRGWSSGSTVPSAVSCTANWLYCRLSRRLRDHWGYWNCCRFRLLQKNRSEENFRSWNFTTVNRYIILQFSMRLFALAA